jgi:exocyst complex component 2
MALEVIKLYISLLSTFFTLSDPSIPSKAKSGEESVPGFVPPGTTVLAACHFAEKLVDDVNEGIGELMNVDIGSEAGNGLKNMLDSLKWRMQEVISALWARGTSPQELVMEELMVDSKNLHFLEDWQPIPNQKGTTRYLDTLQSFQLRVLASSHKIALRADVKDRERDALPSNHRKKIKESFVESLCFLFDGILNGAMATPQLDNRRPSRVSASRVLTVRDIVYPSHPFVDLTDEQETRLLVTLAKFHQLKESTLPSLLNTASKTLDADLSDDRETLLQVIDNMDQLVFEEFVKKRSRGLVDVMENGILRGGVDWLNAGKPTGESRGASEASSNRGIPHGKSE